MGFLRRYRFEIILFFVALAVRLFLFGLAYTHEKHSLLNTIHGDDGYFEISRNLSLGHGFTGEENPPYTPNPLRPPVYPIFLAFFLKISGGNYWFPFLAQLIFGSTIPVLALLVLRKFSFSEQISRAAAYTLSLEPFTVLLSFIFYTETLFTVLFLVSLFVISYFIRNPENLRYAVWSGLTLACATLVKPTIQYFPFLIVLLCIFWQKEHFTKKFWRALVAFLCVFGATLTPWFYRNYVEFGVVGMSAQKSFNLYVYMIPTVRALANGTSFAQEHQKIISEPGFLESAITPATDSFYTQKALAVLKDYPKELLISFGITELTFFTHDGMITVLDHIGRSPSVGLSAPVPFLLVRPLQLIQEIGRILSPEVLLLIAARLFWIIVAILFFIEVAIQLKNYNSISRERLFAILLIAYFAVTTSINGLGVNARFRIPVNVFILAFAYAALERVAYRMKANASHV